MAKVLNDTEFLGHSGIKNLSGKIHVIKAHQFKKMVDIAVGRDAPKDVAKIYYYQKDSNIRKSNSATWPTYIIKIGHKWYPNESITEQLITDIGLCLGVKIAQSKLFEIEGVIRFCSQHFHSKDQILTSGAEILSRFMGKSNEDWIDSLDKKKKLKSSVHIEDVIQAIKSVFEKHAESILNDFYTMLLFDCFTGNNDRHYYNWGVITHLTRKHPPYFSPIYDSSRGLWWNRTDNSVSKILKDKNTRKQIINRYVDNSLPKIALPRNVACNHFELIKYLFQEKHLTSMNLNKWTSRKILVNIYDIIDNKYNHLMIESRRNLIKETLKIRMNKMKEIIS